jgi:DNA-binding response OmpR family regulator
VGARPPDRPERSGDRDQTVTDDPASIPRMASQKQPEETVAAPLTVLVHSDDSTTRERMRMALGRRVAPDLPRLEIVEVATQWAVLQKVRAGGLDLVILDGEATPSGGLGICRTIKEEVAYAPPVLVVLGRPQDDWLAAWSRADAVAMHPIDPVAFAAAVERLLRSVLGVVAPG